MEKERRRSTWSARRATWQYPPASTPRILHLPRRQNKKKQQLVRNVSGEGVKWENDGKRSKGKLEVLFDQERAFARENDPIVMIRGDMEDETRRQRVEEDERVAPEDAWRFQAEMLRAECRLLRMEREIVVNAFERRGIELEKALKSTIHILILGRQRTSDDQMAVSIQREIIKLEKLQRKVRWKHCDVIKHNIVDRRIARFGKDGKEMAGKSCSFPSEDKPACNRSQNMEILKREMKKLSRERLLEKIQGEYCSMMQSPGWSSTSTKRIEYDNSKLVLKVNENESKKERGCSGCCKAIVKRVLEEVKAESEQWSQMQEMLEEVRKEMDELQCSKDYWEERAHEADCQVRILRTSMREWEKKALEKESSVNELQSQVRNLHKELERSRNELTEKEVLTLEMEKRVLACRLFKNSSEGEDKKGARSRGPPLRDVTNLPVRSSLYVHRPVS